MVIGKTKNHFFVGRRNDNLVNMSWLSKIHILRCSVGLIEATATYLSGTLYCLPAPSEYLCLLTCKSIICAFKNTFGILFQCVYKVMLNRRPLDSSLAPS